MRGLAIMDFAPRPEGLQPPLPNEEERRKRRFINGWRRKRQPEAPAPLAPVALLERNDVLTPKPTTLKELWRGFSFDRTVDSLPSQEVAGDQLLEPTENEAPFLQRLQRVGRAVMDSAHTTQREVQALPQEQQVSIEPEAHRLDAATEELAIELRELDEVLEGTIEIPRDTVAPKQSERAATDTDQKDTPEPEVIDGEVTAESTQELPEPSPFIPRALEKPVVTEVKREGLDVASFALMALVGGGLFTALANKVGWQKVQQRRASKATPQPPKPTAEQAPTTPPEQSQATLQEQTLQLREFKAQPELQGRPVTAQQEQVRHMSELVQRQAELTHAVVERARQTPEAAATYRIPEQSPKVEPENYEMPATEVVGESHTNERQKEAGLTRKPQPTTTPVIMAEPDTVVTQTTPHRPASLSASSSNDTHPASSQPRTNQPWLVGAAIVVAAIAIWLLVAGL